MQQSEKVNPLPHCSGTSCCCAALIKALKVKAHPHINWSLYDSLVGRWAACRLALGLWLTVQSNVN